MRDGDDLIYRLDVTMIEAALGTKAYVPALDGDIEVKLHAGHAAGRGQVYRNRGVPALQGYGRGDLKVVVNVAVPRNLTDEQRELLEQFAELTRRRTTSPTRASSTRCAPSSASDAPSAPGSRAARLAGHAAIDYDTTVVDALLDAAACSGWQEADGGTSSTFWSGRRTSDGR